MSHEEAACLACVRETFAIERERQRLKEDQSSLDKTLRKVRLSTFLLGCWHNSSPRRLH